MELTMVFDIIVDPMQYIGLLWSPAFVLQILFVSCCFKAVRYDGLRMVSH